MKTFSKSILIAAGVVLVAGGGFAAWRYGKPGAPATTYRTAVVTRGAVVSTIGASGTVEPEELVDVGAQVAGQILRFGKDRAGRAIDYGSEVEEGMVLAVIDDAVYQAAVAEATAQLAQASANQLNAEASRDQLKAKLHQANRDWERAKKLGPSDALAESSYDNYQAAYEIAKANLAMGEAAITQAKASVAQNQAVLQRAQRNLGFCTIVSPVRGVVIDRCVNIGQTVVSSLNAPSLFLIAKDLKRMQVWVAVNEADIGNVHPGQPVSFTVDAFPGETFRGTVKKVRLNASMSQNVVTYTVEVSTDNPGGRLLPYLTANAQFELARRDNVLRVPNGALRWQPKPEQTAAAAGAKPAKARHPGAANGSEDAAGTATVWVLDGALVRPVAVHAGITDGIVSEISGEGVTEGLTVVVGEKTAATTETPTSGTVNPFTPKMPSRRSAAPPPPPPR
ncbi:MAG: efflux RND transporter periplasmic adaptor subunit [Lentisphaeria bacterium]